MANEDRFKQAIVTTLAKRAANRCSNPDCDTITSGPADDPSKSVNVGEAAHIFGASPGSARYDSLMASADRSAISNAIWLCGNCHKLVDDDPNRYPAGLLFEWQKSHEQMISSEIGKTGAALRRRYEARHLEELGRLSYLAERLVLEKGDCWEFLLTAEVLRFEMEPVILRWNALERDLYTKPITRIAPRDFPHWLFVRMAEATNIAGAFGGLLNGEIQRAWGEPGVAGDEKLIIFTCRIFAEMCASALAWEEQVRFAKSHEAFDEVLQILRGTTGCVIEEALKVPKFLTDTFAEGDASGKYELSLVLTLPDEWAENLAVAMDRAAIALSQVYQTGGSSFDWLGE